MATTYYSNCYNTLIDAKTNGTQTSGGTNAAIKQNFSYNVANGSAFVINDVIKLVPIPLNYQITNFFIDVPDLDSSTGFVMALGDDTTADKYVTGSTVGQATGFLTPTSTGAQHNVIPTAYTTKHASRVCPDYADDFAMKVTTAASGTAATTGIIQGWVEYAPVGLPT